MIIIIARNDQTFKYFEDFKISVTGFFNLFFRENTGPFFTNPFLTKFLILYCILFALHTNWNCFIISY